MKTTMSLLLPGRRFTLIELLVVIAIIAILASMLMPALQQARETAYGATCRANLKSLGFGMVTYSDNYDGYIVPGKFAISGYPNKIWIDQIAIACGKPWAYEQEWIGSKAAMNKNKIFVCPAEKKPWGNYADKSGFSYTHYALNAQLAGEEITAATIKKMRKTSSLTKPSIAIGLGDSKKINMYAVWSANRTNCWAYRHGGPYEWNYYVCTGDITLLSYMDGHAGTCRRADMETRDLMSEGFK